MQFNVIAQIERPDLEDLDAITDMIDLVDAAGAMGTTVGRAERRPVTLAPRRTEVTATFEAPTLAAAASQMATTLEPFGVTELRVLPTTEFDAEIEEIGQSPTITTTEAAQILGMTTRGVMQIVNRTPERLAPILRGTRATLFDRRDVLALAAARESAVPAASAEVVEVAAAR